MYVNTSWTEYHSAGASILTAAPVPEADTASSVGAVLVVGFLVTITVIAFGRVLAPIATSARRCSAPRAPCCSPPEPSSCW